MPTKKGKAKYVQCNNENIVTALLIVAFALNALVVECHVFICY